MRHFRAIAQDLAALFHIPVRFLLSFLLKYVNPRNLFLSRCVPSFLNLVKAPSGESGSLYLVLDSLEPSLPILLLTSAAVKKSLLSTLYIFTNEKEFFVTFG